MSKNLRNKTIILAAAVIAAAFLNACYQRTAYFHYHSTPLDGWNRQHQLTYEVSPVTHPGYYVEEIGVRTTAQYRYQQLFLVVEQFVVHTANHQMGKMKSDTICIDIYDSKGRPQGTGISTHQLIYPLKSLKLETGDSLVMRIRHNMHAISPNGIAAIGLKLTEM